MPISGSGWEFHVIRTHIQNNGSRTRTVGSYQVFHDGNPVAALSGTVAESAGPGSNAAAGNKKRVEQGRYPMSTQNGSNYCTIGYTSNENHAAFRRPSLELTATGNRSEILIHPGIGFLSSVGCLNLCTRLPDAAEPISFGGSRRRVIAVIDDLTAFLGLNFPASNGRSIPNAFVVIDGEP